LSTFLGIFRRIDHSPFGDDFLRAIDDEGLAREGRRAGQDDRLSSFVQERLARGTARPDLGTLVRGNSQELGYLSLRVGEQRLLEVVGLALQCRVLNSHQPVAS
jgi:hypothetical protein